MRQAATVLQFAPNSRWSGHIFDCVHSPSFQIHRLGQFGTKRTVLIPFAPHCVPLSQSIGLRLFFQTYSRKDFHLLLPKSICFFYTSRLAKNLPRKISQILTDLLHSALSFWHLHAFTRSKCRIIPSGINVYRSSAASYLICILTNEEEMTRRKFHN